MLIFSYHITALMIAPAGNDKIFRIVITDDEKDNVTTWFRGKKYKHTLAPKDIKHIIKIIKAAPGLFDIPKELESNDSLGSGTIYGFTFCDGERTNSFYGKDILDYGRQPRKKRHACTTHGARNQRESPRAQQYSHDDFEPITALAKIPKRV